MGVFGNRESGFFGVSAGGSPTPITNTLQTVVNTAPQGSANKGFYVTNNSGLTCGNIDDLVDAEQLLYQKDDSGTPIYITKSGVDSAYRGQLIKYKNNGGNQEQLVINSNFILYKDINLGRQNTFQQGAGINNTIFLQPDSGGAYGDLLVQQPPYIDNDFSSITTFTPDTSQSQRNFLCFGLNVASTNGIITLGALILNKSVTQFCVQAIDTTSSLEFQPDSGFTIFGTTLYNKFNFISGGLISVIRVDNQFFMSYFI